MSVGRPRKDRKCSKHSVSLSPESQDIIERCGYQSNLSDYLNTLIRNSAEDSPTYLAIQIERLTKEIVVQKEQLELNIARRDMLQSRHNLIEKRLSGTEAATREARLELLRLWDRCLTANRGTPGRAEAEFEDALGGPAYLHLIREGGLHSPSDALAWVKAEARGR